MVSQWRLSATLPFPLACPRPPRPVPRPSPLRPLPRPCLSVGLSLCQQALWGFAPPTILPEGPKLQRAAPEKSRRPGGSQGGVAWRRILVEGAIALPVTLSGGALFAS